MLHKGIGALEFPGIALWVGHKAQSSRGSERDLCGRAEIATWAALNAETLLRLSVL